MNTDTKVLVAEDFAPTATLLSKLLYRANFRLLFAAGVEETIRIARRELPDVILLDVNLVDGNGMKAAQALREDPATAGIPIVAMSSMDPAELRDLAEAAGCDEYLSKPFTVYDLTWRVARCLWRSQPAAPSPG